MATTAGRAEPGTLRAGPGSLWIALGAAVCVGTGLRVAMSFESFWFDEVWSYHLATSARNAWAILTELRHDNNHLLNSWYLYAVSGWVGDRGHWFWYRVPSLVAGVASLGVLPLIARRWGRLEAAFVTALAALSYPLVQASGQARGYGVAILASLVFFWLSLQLVEREGERPTAAVPAGAGWRLVASWIVAVTGLLAHPTFVYVLAAVAVWTLARHRAAGLSWARVGLLQLQRHGVPFAALVFLYAVFYAHLVVGGGPVYDRFAVVREAFSQTMALPRRGPGSWLSFGLGTLLAGSALLHLHRLRDGRWLFFAAVLLVVPAAIVVLSDPPVFYARYLLLCFPWFYLATAIALAVLWRRSGAGRAAAALLLLLLLVANAARDVRVLATGRGDYARAVAYMDAHSQGPWLEVGSDHDGRNAPMLRFYARGLPSGRRLRYSPRDALARERPEWYLRHDWSAGRDPDPIQEPVPGLRYGLVESFEHGPGDGFRWFIYRKLP